MWSAVAFLVVYVKALTTNEEIALNSLCYTDLPPPYCSFLFSACQDPFGFVTCNSNENVIGFKLTNYYPSIPTELGLLENLQTLDLSWNKFVELPTEIGLLAEL